MMQFHFHAPKNWINDPNGFIYYKGLYHLFYQYFPYGRQWGTMHWGHATSKDLVHYTHHDLALFPTIREDQNGCFSGTAIEKDGQMVLAYTGVRYLNADPLNIHQAVHDDFVSCQLLISSPDGFHFDNFQGKQVILPVSTDPHRADPVHTRDPKLIQVDDGWLMLLGSQTNHQGKVLFYKSADLKNWEYLSEYSHPLMGGMCECPDLLETGGQFFLIFSGMGIENAPGWQPNQAVMVKIDFDQNSGTITFSGEGEYLDYGMELYAPQSARDENGAMVMQSWLRMPMIDEPWIGLFAYPRILQVREGKVCWRPHPNIQNLFQEEIPPEKLDPRQPFCLKARLKAGQQLEIAGLKVGYDGLAVYTDRSRLLKNRDLNPAAYAPVQLETAELEIYGDQYIFEVYINHGQRVITQFVDSFTHSTQLDQAAHWHLYQAETEKEQD